MMKVLEENNMSNLTSVSNEARSVSSNNISDNLTQPPSPPHMKKRNQPGHPDPNAEVIALSPKTLLATNRFVCEICKKGFQRDQNLQLHRRGHNLPWKLKQKANCNNEVVRKKVYVCPETGCVHHDPSRALGDLTGIKKHFSRKHGEKKWKCQKCSKKYAVQCDWKAHSKICGTREYRCGCGTLFSRKDSFITHRAFCEVLENNSRNTIIPILQSNPNNSSQFPHHTNLPQIPIQSQFNNFSNKSIPFPIKKKEVPNFSLRSEIPPWLSPPPVTPGPCLSGPPPPPVDFAVPPPPPSPSLFQDFQQNPNPNPNPTSSTAGPIVLPSSSGPSPAGALTGFHRAHLPLPDELGNNGVASYNGGAGTGSPAGEISNLPSSSSSSCFALHGFDFEESLKFEEAIDEQLSNRTTRDFLGLRETDIFSLSSYMNYNNAHKSWQG